MSETIRSWPRLRSVDEVVERLCALYDERGGFGYDEAVTQAQHAVQCAELARREGAPTPLIVAALLHDVGHLLLGEAERRDEARASDLHHEVVAARFLATWFGPDVTEPIARHVDAKRYLCAIEPSYRDGLSPASVHSLELQGGPMTRAEAEAWASSPRAADAVALRRWDDAAKDPERPTVRFREFAPLVAATAHLP